MVILRTWKLAKFTKQSQGRGMKLRYDILACLNFAIFTDLVVFVRKFVYAYHEQEDDDDEEEEVEEEAPTLVKVDDEEAQKNKRLEKKRRLKERFNAEYDDGDATYFDDLKEEMQKQAEVSVHSCNMFYIH